MPLGLLFLFATLLLWFRSATRSRRLLLTEMLLVVLMIAATMYVQHGILPAMEHDRTGRGRRHCRGAAEQSRARGLRPAAQPLGEGGRIGAVAGAGSDSADGGRADRASGRQRVES